MSKKILIVEDEILVAMELEAMLEDNGHSPVGIAPDAPTALRLGQCRPDVALVDINLRDGATGINVGETLARDHGVKVVFTSANPSLLGEGVPGTCGYLPKPYLPDDILAAIRFVTGEATESSKPADLMLFNSWSETHSPAA